MHQSLLLLILCLAAAEQCSAYMQCREFASSHYDSDCDRALLFTIRAHSGLNAYDAFQSRNDTVNFVPKGQDAPDTFTSGLLINLDEAVQEFGATRIVAEMRKSRKPVAWAAFDVRRGDESTNLNDESWFAPDRLVQTYPFWTGKRITSFEDFSIHGHKRYRYWRSFYINYEIKDCERDGGLMGISEPVRGVGALTIEACDWGKAGGAPPVMFYATRRGPYSEVVDYADEFLVYMQR